MLVKAELTNTRLGCEKDTAADVGFQTDENLGHSDVPLLTFFHTIALVSVPSRNFSVSNNQTRPKHKGLR